MINETNENYAAEAARILADLGHAPSEVVSGLRALGASPVTIALALSDLGLSPAEIAKELYPVVIGTGYLGNILADALDLSHDQVAEALHKGAGLTLVWVRRGLEEMGLSPAEAARAVSGAWRWE